MINEQEKSAAVAAAKSDEAQQKETLAILILKEAFYWIRVVVFTFLAVYLLSEYVIIIATIPSGSMENTIMTGDKLIGTRFAYWFSEPKRGDIIIFKYPVDESHTYIKRVIGLPGETVRIEDGKVYIDDAQEPLDEFYLKEEWVDGNDGYTFTVPEDSYFMMGDNRNDSKDSRFWASEALLTGVAATEEEAEPYTFVKKKNIMGKEIFAYYKKARMLH